MTFTAAIEGSDICFSAESDEALLDAAERAGYTLPYSCRKGVCASCAGTLRRGVVQERSRRIEGPAEGVLFCQARAASDVVIAPRRIDRYDPAARIRTAARLYRLSRPCPDVALLHLRLPAGTRAKFQSGQYLRVTLPDGSTRNFSMANPPHESDGVQLHVRHVPGGAFSETVLATLQQGDVLQIELPFGDFRLRHDFDGDVVFVATGTGFAPFKSMVEDLIKRGNRRAVRLYWGGRRIEDLYLAELPQKWAARAPWFSFVPVLSEADSAWQGRRGLVHRAVLEDFGSLADRQVYACGNPVMIRSARADFTGRGNLPEDSFFADPFVPSGGAD